MLRSLLAERFKLVVHKDEKPLNVYVLSVGKRGARLQESGGPGLIHCKVYRRRSVRRSNSGDADLTKRRIIDDPPSSPLDDLTMQ
jgi:uncharacterized protein (TIGR03435 family)